MTKLWEPGMAERAFFFHLQGLPAEYIAMRLGVTEGHANRLIRDGNDRAALNKLIPLRQQEAAE